VNAALKEVFPFGKTGATLQQFAFDFDWQALNAPLMSTALITVGWDRYKFKMSKIDISRFCR
jgi:hypothetical protein